MPPSRPRLLPALAAALATMLVLPASSLGASATIGAVDCDAGGATATLRNDSGGPARFTVLRDDVAIATAVVPAGGPPVTRIVPIAEGAAARITVRFGSSYVSSYARRSCTGGADAATRLDLGTATAAAAAPSPVVPGTGIRGAATAQPDAGDDAAANDVTIRDARSIWPLLLAAVLALSIAGTLLWNGHVRHRRAAGSRQEPAARRRA